MSTRFSVIIPTYNRADVIAEAVDSVLAQSYAPFEVVIVDDGSTDDTEEALHAYLSDDRIKYVTKPHSGAADTRNVGVASSTNEFITFLDSDDLADESWLDRFAQMIDEGALLGCCSVRFVSPTDTHLSHPEDKGPAFHNFVMKFTNGGSYFLRRDIFQAVGGFDPDLRAGQHTELGIRVAEYCHQQGIRIENIDEPLITVRRTRQDHIRKNDESVYLGATHFVKKHRGKLELDKDFLYNYLSVIVVRGTKQPLSDILSAYVELWTLRPFSLKTYYRFFKDIVYRRLLVR